MLDPAFAGKILDPSYLTTLAGTRGVFYDTATADPAMIAYDDAHKGVVSATEATDIAAAVVLPPALNHSSKVQVPILTVMGGTDKLFCNTLVDCSSDDAVQKFEAPYYPRATSFTARTVPDTGHDLTLHPSAGQSFAIINDWIRSH